MLKIQILIGFLLVIIFSIGSYGQKSLKADYVKKIQESTPKPLPQSPVVKRLTSDAQDDNLKGKVKSIIEEREGLTGIEKPIGIRPSGNAYYDEQGNYLKQVSFDYRGVPYYIVTYGFIEGARVSLSNSISYGDSDRAGTTGKQRQKQEVTTKPDTRYDLRYEYKYKDGRLSEMQLFNNKSEKSMRYVYKYKPNQMEVFAYTEDDELNSKYRYLYDENGTEIGRIDFNVRQPEIPESNKFKYENIVLDEKGNWIKRTFSKLEVENGKEVYTLIAVEYRTITYYP
jgi:hypothetical protein